jgi:hypothetical protein
MTDIPPAKDRRKGIASFDDDDEIPVPTPKQVAAAKTAGEGLGFRSEKPAPALLSSTGFEKVRVGGNGRPAVFTANFHIRTRPEDRERFEDFAHRHRITKGEAMTRLLDFAEAEERRHGS